MFAFSCSARNSPNRYPQRMIQPPQYTMTYFSTVDLLLLLSRGEAASLWGSGTASRPSRCHLWRSYHIVRMTPLCRLAPEVTAVIIVGLTFSDSLTLLASGWLPHELTRGYIHNLKALQTQLLVEYLISSFLSYIPPQRCPETVSF